MTITSILEELAGSQRPGAKALHKGNGSRLYALDLKKDATQRTQGT